MVNGQNDNRMYLGPSGHVIVAYSDLNARIRNVKDIVDKEMGFAEDEPPPNLRYFVAVNEKGRGVGMVTAHRVDEAHRMIGYENGSLLIRDNKVEKVKLGIHQMWTHRRSRGLGVCTALIDKARETMVYGEEVGRGETAFSSPTGDGVKMARKYARGGNVMVYDC